MIVKVLSFWLATAAVFAADLPQRAEGAITGSQFIVHIASLELSAREAEIKKQALKGNVPKFWRKFVPVRVKAMIDGRERVAEYLVAPDYFCIGSDEDYFLTPMRPETAQAIADEFGWTLPTTKMVDDIYAASVVKLAPSPIPPSTNMTKVWVFAEHNETVRKQRGERVGLVAGHKKDVVITSRWRNSPGRVDIYGWHKLDGKAIQPLYLGHTSNWVDYSHGIRFVAREMMVDGNRTTVDAVLRDEKLCVLLTGEGPGVLSRYGENLGGK